MPRYKCTIAYDGANFYGYQVQPGKRTVQKEIEKVLEHMHKGKKVKSMPPAGRRECTPRAKSFTLTPTCPCRRNGGRSR